MNSLCVLIVDDSPVMRKIIERSLRQAGIEISEVMEARSGDEALTAIQNKKPGLILTDINMPAMNGIEFVRRLQNISTMQDVPVVMITTEAGDVRIHEALSLGAAGYLPKPFTREQVQEQILPLVNR